MKLDKIMDWWVIGLIFGGISIAGTLILKWLGSSIPTITFAAYDNINVRQQIAQGMSPEIGNNVLKYFGGMLPTDIFGYLAVIVSAVIIVLLGRGAYELFGQPLGGKQDTFTKLLYVMGYSAILLSLINIFFLNMPFSLVFVAVIIYFLLGALVMYLLSQSKLIEIPQ